MSRIDLVNRAIPRALFGYDRTQVDRLMQDLSDALTRVTDEKRHIATKVQNLETRLEELKERETAMQDTIMATRHMGDEIRAAAQKEAQLILETARVKADALLQNANMRLGRLMEEAAEAKKAHILFEMKLRAVIGDHLRLLDLNRQQSASLDATAKKLFDRVNRTEADRGYGISAGEPAAEPTIGKDGA